MSQEVGDLRSSLQNEVDSLRTEFAELKTALKQQLEILAAMDKVGAHRALHITSNRMLKTTHALFHLAVFVKRDHCTALWAVQHPNMTPTSFFSVVG